MNACLALRNAHPLHLHKMNAYDIHFFKTEHLSPDEKSALRKGASGLWLCGGRISASSARAACAAYRKSGELGSRAAKLRAKRCAHGLAKNNP
jgi:hypothetical protein